MATISTTITLVDKMSRNINNISTSVAGLCKKMGALETDVGSAETRLNNTKFEKFSDTLGSLSSTLSGIGDVLSTLAVPATLLGGKAYKNAVSYEEAMANVQKTTGETAEVMANLDAALREMTENTPVENGFVQAANTMAMAAQLGVRGEGNLIKFTETYEKLVTSTNISGEGGAESIAQFLNIMDGGVQNVERFASTIVELGNNFATTENDILSMGTRMAATGKLAGLSTAEILALSTTLNSVGINAEAGGSAMSKLLKQMQSAAEVGLQAQNLFGTDYGNATAFSYFIDDSGNLLTVAQQMGATTEYVQSLADAWLALEDFSEISGRTAEQFAADWSGDPMTAIQGFISGLYGLDAAGQESVIAAMERMGISEIRESNMIAALASNPVMLAEAAQRAYAAYASNTALGNEFATFLGTQGSQNQMLKNKFNNSLADLGDNVVEAVQPILDMANGLLEALNGLSEVNQDRIAGVMKSLVIGGVSEKLINKTVSLVKTIIDLASIPWVRYTAAAAGVGVLLAAITDIEDPLSRLREDSRNIELSFSQESVDAALAQVAEVQGQVELLSGGETTQLMQGYSAAVAQGYGTQSMYNQAVAYENAAAREKINNMLAGYGVQMAELEKSIARAETDAEREKLLAQYNALVAAQQTELNTMRSEYTGIMSGLFGGMAQQLYPEETALLKSVSAYNDLIAAVTKFQEYEESINLADTSNYAEYDARLRSIYEMAYALSDINPHIAELFDGGTVDSAMDAWLKSGRVLRMDGYLVQAAMEGLTSLQETLGNSPIISDMLQTMLQSDSIIENLDLRYADGLLADVLGIANFKQMLESGSSLAEYGAYLTEGLMQGATEQEGTIISSWDTVKNQALAALRTAFGIASPSTVMAAEGIYLTQGIALGVTSGQGALTAAIYSVSAAGVQAASVTMSTAAGHAIGSNFGSGIVQGIQSKYAAVVSAARSMASAAASAVRNTLDIHSPSRVTEEIGAYFGEGFAGGIAGTGSIIVRATEGIADRARNAITNRVWKGIELFSGLENEMFLDPDGDIHLSDSDVRRMRDLAEREAINQFTTAELHVEFTANNNINSNMDLDGVVSYLEDQLTERLEMAAEGVYT